MGGWCYRCSGGGGDPVRHYGVLEEDDPELGCLMLDLELLLIVQRKRKTRKSEWETCFSQTRQKGGWESNQMREWRTHFVID